MPAPASGLSFLSQSHFLPWVQMPLGFLVSPSGCSCITVHLSSAPIIGIKPALPRHMGPSVHQMWAVFACPGFRFWLPVAFLTAPAWILLFFGLHAAVYSWVASLHSASRSPSMPPASLATLRSVWVFLSFQQLSWLPCLSLYVEISLSCVSNLEVNLPQLCEKTWHGVLLCSALLCSLKDPLWSGSLL